MFVSHRCIKVAGDKFMEEKLLFLLMQQAICACHIQFAYLINYDTK